MNPELKAVLQRVDWLRVTSRLSTLVRSMRGDAELEHDHDVETNRGRKLLDSIDGAARQALNCKAPQPCACPMCEGESQ